VGIDGIARIGKVIDHATDKFLGTILETRKNYNQTVFLYNASGDDSVPCKNDKVIILKVDGTGNFIGAGILTESQGAKPGEKIFFGRDADGKITSKLSMLNDGNIEAEADGDIKQTTKKNHITEAKKDSTIDAENIKLTAKKDIESKADNVKTEAKTKATVKGGDVELIGKVKTKDGSFECNGMASPNGQGCLCAQPFCLVTGAPQTGNKAEGT